MKILRFAVITLFLALVGFVAFGSHAAQVAPAAAATAAGIILWQGFVLFTPTDQGLVCALGAAAGLKLDKVLDIGLQAFKRRIAPLLMFSKVLSAVEVPRDKVVQVPFVPLQSLASVDWNPANGYTDADFTIQTRPVPLDKRKFQVISFTADQLRGLPVDALALTMEQNMDRLAYDVILDVLGGVTIANFGAAIHTGAASAFDTDDIADIGTALTQADWPSVGMNLILDSTFCNPLKKDASLKNAQASGSTTTLREGVIGRVSGFDVHEVPNFPTNAEKLAGIAALQFGLLIASAPIEATEEVQHQLSDYRQVTDKDTGLTLTYRAWGNADFDKAKRIVEVGYGFAKGDAAQIKRIAIP